MPQKGDAQGDPRRHVLPIKLTLYSIKTDSPEGKFHGGKG